MSGTASSLDLAAALVCGLEGFRSAPYLDTAGVWTVGDGSTRINGQPVTASTPPIDKATALALMKTELAPICATVAAHAPDGATPNQVAACSSFAYNVGIAAFLGSTLCAMWGRGETGLASDQFMQWIYDHDPVTHQLVRVQGLVNRRKAEQAVFLGTATT